MSHQLICSAASNNKLFTFPWASPGQFWLPHAWVSKYAGSASSFSSSSLSSSSPSSSSSLPCSSAVALKKVVTQELGLLPHHTPQCFQQWSRNEIFSWWSAANGPPWTGEMEQLSPCRFLTEGARDDPTAGKLKLLILFGSTSQDQITTWFSSREHFQEIPLVMKVPR